MMCRKCQTVVIEVEVDHIVPVGPTPGSRNAAPDVTWDGWINRLFCDASGLQCLCNACHAEKTKAAL